MSHAKVEFDGNLTKDPDVKIIPSGTTLAKSGIAVDRGHYDKETNNWIPAVGFYNIAAFGKTAEKLGKIGKGWRIFGCGELSQSRYQTAEGENKSSIEIIIARIYFATPPKTQGSPQQQREPYQDRRPAAQQGNSVADMVNQKLGDGAEFDDDGIPF